MPMSDRPVFPREGIITGVEVRTTWRRLEALMAELVPQGDVRGQAVFMLTMAAIFERWSRGHPPELGAELRRAAADFCDVAFKAPPEVMS